jgi:hypothetical protein
MISRKAKVCILITAVLAVIFVTFEGSRAVPGFARQTNLPCSSCHNVFPELNAFGRMFKMHGYTLGADESVKATDNSGHTILELPKAPPVSMVVSTGFSHLASRMPGTLNNNIDFPQELGVFFAAKLTPEMGAFVQATYEDTEGDFAIDMVDVRYAHQTTLGSRDFVLGATLNNNPTVQDVWDNVPMWSFPYEGSPVTPSSAATPLIDGGFDGQAMGLGPYIFWENRVYGEISLYRSVPQGGPTPPDAGAEMTISKAAPYWRLAFQHQMGQKYFEIGTYGMSAKLFPSGVSGMTDNYTDIAVDAQYEQKFSGSNITAHAYWIGENQKLKATYAGGGSDHETVKLNTFRINGNFYPGPHFGFSLGYLATFGDTDSTLYAPAPVFGSREGKPNTNALVAEVDFLPWLNTKFALQYVMFSKFNGASDDYDGFGRDASDNNTLYVSTTLGM